MPKIYPTIAMMGKSLQLDLDFMMIKRLSIFDRAFFLLQKYAALFGFLFHAKSLVRLRNIRFNASNLSSLGTLQSSIVDFYSEIICPEVIQKKNPVILDIGANVGQFCLAAKLFYPQAQIYSFEPDPDIYNELRANTRNLEKVRLFNYGLGRAEEEREFYIHNLSLMSSFKKYKGVDYAPENIKKLKVKVLDKEFPAGKKTDLIKVDVEGFEQEVIMGAKKTFANAQHLLIELSLDREAAQGSNLSLLSAIHAQIPQAKIIKFGRPLGKKVRPTCQDALLSLRG